MPFRGSTHASRLCTSENAPARSFPANSKCSRFIWVRFRTAGGMCPVTDKRSSCRERPVVAAKVGLVMSDTDALRICTTRAEVVAPGE